MRTIAIRRAAPILLAGLLLTGAPAAADEGPHVTDHCGDTVLYAEGGGQVVSAPDPRDRRHDVRALWFTSVFDEDGDEVTYLGMDVTVQFCHPAALPAYNDHLTVSWDLDGELECSEYLDLYRQKVLGSLDTILYATYTYACPGDVPGHYYYLWTHDLGAFRAVRVAGDTITWSLRLDLLPEHRHVNLQPGTVWRAPRAVTRQQFTSPPSAELAAAGATVVAAVFRDDAGPGRDATVGG